jgi:hypothetical protein
MFTPNIVEFNDYSKNKPTILINIIEKIDMPVSINDKVVQKKMSLLLGNVIYYFDSAKQVDEFMSTCQPIYGSFSLPVSHMADK